MPRVSLFPSLLDPARKIDVDTLEVFDMIRTGAQKQLIDKIRSGEDLKKKLPAVTFSGVFSERKASALQEKSGLICLDYDNLDDVARKKAEIVQDPFTYSCFISPSGNGIKQIIKVDPAGDHTRQFEALFEYYQGIDTGKDISRLCFVSYDPEIYVNLNSTTWYQEKAPIKQEFLSIKEDKTKENLLKWFTKNYTMAQGSRNSSLFVLACSLLEYGVVDIEETLMEYSNGLPEKEVLQVLHSARQKTKETAGTKKFEEAQEIKVTLTLPKEQIVIDPRLIDGIIVKKIIASMYKIRFNEITQRQEINGKDVSDSDEFIIYDKVNTFIKTQTGTKKELTKTAFNAGLALLAEENSYHPLQEFFSKKKWDNVGRLQEFLACFEDKHDQSQSYIKKWIIGAIEKLHNPTFQNEVLVLEGATGIGKTRTVSLLAKPFNKYTRFGGALNPDNKDHKLELTNNFIYEWGEGSNINKRSEDSLKELLTASYITERAAYARHPVTKPVTASIIMTKNSGSFLRDDAEKRRFNILYINKIDARILQHDFDIAQIWLEAYDIWLNDSKKKWAIIDQDVKNLIFESAMDRPTVWELLDKIIKPSTENDGFTLDALHKKIEELDSKWDRNKYGNRKDIRAYFKRKYGIEAKKSRICSQSDEPPFFCFVGVRLKA